MTYEEFVKNYQAGTIKVHVVRNASGFLYETPGLMPHHVRKRQALIRTATFGLMILGLILFFFVKWYIAAAVLFAGMFMATRATKAAGEGVLEAARADPRFYELVTEKGILRIEPA
ncbi:hypothetical protein [Microvirga subterranea]|uniref:Uncharacterized protein n=1 Tax=Microvirga subterranea TaxID=186651 RepID=A0A370HPI0_9HYPH|nr:hypothetical protein [Microvirga subterranea]RDI60145.1 hypothetical protein DES45_103406 [Microvirga subterranea]